jgi:hypothetical protein
MTMRCFVHFLLCWLCLVQLSGCTALKNSKRKKAAEAMGRNQAEAPKEIIVGQIELVNPMSQFVLIRSNRTMEVATDTELGFFHNGQLAGKIRVTPERKSLFLTADILSGSPAKGDAVMLTTAPVSTAPAPEVAPPSQPQPLQPPAWPAMTADTFAAPQPANPIPPGAVGQPAAVEPLPPELGGEPDGGEFLRIVPSTSAPR